MMKNQGGDLFIVDNSDREWKVRNYLDIDVQSFMPLIDTSPSRLLLFDVNAKSKAILGEKEVTIKENDHVTSRNA